MATTTASTGTLDAINDRLAALNAQVDYLIEQTRQAEQRRREWEDFKADFSPVLTEAYQMAVREFSEIEEHVQAEDLFRLLKRLARNTGTLEAMLDQLESVSEGFGDAMPLGKDAFMGLLTRLDDLERRGYFDFLRNGAGVIDRVVTSFSEDDVKQLGDNIVLILETVKEMTQPEVMLMLRRTMTSVREEEMPPEEPSLFKLLGQMRDPQVKRGLARLLSMLRSMGETRAAAPIQR